MKKKSLLFTFIFFICINSIFSAVYTHGYDKVKIASTKYFDIIYREDSLISAKAIYDNCDKLYEQIISEYNLNRTQRFPVVITRDIEELNAYFSHFPRTHIVLFDTIMTNDNLNVFKGNYLVNIFKHELTHALTLTNENDFFHKVFGQAFSSYILNATPFLAEGIAVNSESKEGFGRINDPLNMSKLIQAKNDNTFPSYLDVQGSRDIYPGLGASYLYGSAFLTYLTNTYSQEKFNEYWNRLGELSFLFADASYLFEEVFSIPLDVAWNNFKNSIVDINFASSLEQKTWENYWPNTVFKDKNNIYFLDKKNNGVFLIEKNKIKKVKDDIKNAESVSVNNNIFSYTMLKNNPLPSYYTIVEQENSNINYNISSFRNSIFLNDYLVGVKNEGSIQSIIYINKNKEIEKKLYLEIDESLQNIAILENKIVFTSRYKEFNSISIINDDDSRTVYLLPLNTSIQGLSTFEDKIIFSTTEKDYLPTLSILNTKNGKLSVLDLNISGGINYPVLKDSNTLYYKSIFFDTVKLNELNISDLPFKTFQLIQLNIDKKEKIESVKAIENVRDYNPLLHLDGGIFTPYIFPSMNFNDLFIGALYYTSDPTELINLYVKSDIKFNFEEQSYYQMLNLSDNTGNKAQNLSLNYVFYKPEEKPLNFGFITKYNINNIINLKSNHNLKLGLNSTFDFTNNLDVDPFSKNSSNLLPTPNNNNILIGSNISYVYHKNMGINNENYFQFETGLINRFDKIWGINEHTNFNISPFVLIHIPYLIPSFNHQFEVKNLPTQIILQYLYSQYTKTSTIGFTSNILLYSKEIQKSTLFIPAYFRRFNLNLNYNFSKNITDNKITNNIVKLIGYFDTGIAYSMATKANLKLGYSIGYDLKDNKPKYEIYIDF